MEGADKKLDKSVMKNCNYLTIFREKVQTV